MRVNFVHFGVSSVGLGLFVKFFSQATKSKVYLSDVYKENRLIADFINNKHFFYVRKSEKILETEIIYDLNFIDIEDFKKLEEIFIEDDFLIFTNNVSSDNEHLVVKAINFLIAKRYDKKINKPLVYLCKHQYQLHNTNFPFVKDPVKYNLMQWNTTDFPVCSLDYVVDKLSNPIYMDENDLIVTIEADGSWIVDTTGLDKLRPEYGGYILDLLKNIDLVSNIKSLEKYAFINYIYETQMKIIAYFSDLGGIRYIQKFLCTEDGKEFLTPLTEELILIYEISDLTVLNEVRRFNRRLLKSVSNTYKILPYTIGNGSLNDFYYDMKKRLNYDLLTKYNRTDILNVKSFFSSIESFI